MSVADSADPARQPTAIDGKSLPPLRWPMSPFIGDGSINQTDQPQACEVEGLNGQSRSCLLVALEPKKRHRWPSRPH
ncbi:hypothetical protein [Tepidimonas sp.]|uniref:hypothetical protein n=1 Tax=Tepidimonas sp. TaxID=2002775 RepID=UPI0026145516|nr:hypothetical protein [Tepidimonas sp.]